MSIFLTIQVSAFFPVFKSRLLVERALYAYNITLQWNWNSINLNNLGRLQLVYMLRSDSNSMSNDLNQLLERKNKLEVELVTKLSADYTELMKILHHHIFHKDIT
ncbi:MAG TPA: hypothetical protein VF220_04050 [Nitrososphaeraceae archaeon]